MMNIIILAIGVCLGFGLGNVIATSAYNKLGTYCKKVIVKQDEIITEAFAEYQKEHWDE